MGANASREGVANSSPPSAPTVSSPAAVAAAATTCPVDHKAREAWLKQGPTDTASRASTPTSNPAPKSDAAANQSCTSSKIDQSPPTTATMMATTRIPPLSPLGLDTTRTISTIPRAASSPTQANAESETGADRTTGNWVYPSEQQFFDAMRRKNHSPRPRDMAAVVPIHNAVNERAWHHILEWEHAAAAAAAAKCGGPKLVSFEGNSAKLTPRARWYGLLGYTAPFDRHDWVVDRCGRRVEYVIDFYKGKGSDLSFYLDVRPKLNSFEGLRMRVMRFLGL